MINMELKKHLLYSIEVGFLHIIMPILGTVFEKLTFSNFIINPNRLMGIILLILTFQILIDIYHNDHTNVKLNIPLLALSVSVDSFFVGIALKELDLLNIVCFVMFFLFSFSFSLLGCRLGSIGKAKLEKTAQYIAVTILLILSVKYLLL